MLAREVGLKRAYRTAFSSVVYNPAFTTGRHLNLPLKIYDKLALNTKLCLVSTMHFSSLRNHSVWREVQGPAGGQIVIFTFVSISFASWIGNTQRGHKSNSQNIMGFWRSKNRERGAERARRRNLELSGCGLRLRRL